MCVTIMLPFNYYAIYFSLISFFELPGLVIGILGLILMYVYI